MGLSYVFPSGCFFKAIDREKESAGSDWTIGLRLGTKE